MAESVELTVQSPINCQFCSVKTIKHKCIDCKRLLCADCNIKIHSLDSAKGHKIVSTDSLDQEIDFASIKCRKHDGNYCCLFCKVCDVSVCPSCIAKEHAKHEMLEINESYNAKIELLKSRRERYEKEKACFSPVLSKLDEKKHEVTKRFGSVDSAITEHEKRLVQRLKHYIEHLRCDLANKKKGYDDSIGNEMTKILAFMDHIDKVLNQTDKVIGLKDATKFFDEAKSVINFKDFARPRPESTAIEIIVPKIDPLYFTIENVGRLVNKDTAIDIKLAIVNRYQTDMTMISHISPCSDGSLWIGYILDKKVQRVQTDGDKLKILNSVDTEVYGMTLSSDNQLLFCFGPVLNHVNSLGELSKSNYKISPYRAISVHVSINKRIVIGGHNSEQERRVVIVMNEKGDQESVYEKDESGVPLFRYPRSITTTSNNCIHVADYLPSDGKGRVVVLGQGGQVVNTYSGHPVVNKDTQFKPESIVTTPTDNVIVVDRDTQTLHVLDNTGHFLRYFNTKDVGIYGPFSLAFTSTGQLYIGCTYRVGNKKKEAKLYLVDISGC